MSPTIETPRNGHTLRATIDTWGPQFTVICHEPIGAPCRLACPKGCDTREPGHEHKLVDIGECVAAEYLNHDGAADTYDTTADQAPLHDEMPIKVYWDGDNYTWKTA